MFSVPGLVATKRSMALRVAKPRLTFKRALLRHPAVESLEDRRLLAVVTWSGGAGASDTHWTTAANWEGGVAPTAGDDLVFSAAALQNDTFNNFSAGTNFASISIDGSNYLLAGNAVALDNGLSVNGGDATVSLPLKLNADQSFRNSVYGTLTLGAVDLNGHQLSLQDDGLAINVAGQISGDGGLVIGGWGYLGVTLSAANSYTGATQVDTGSLHIQDPLALGLTDGTAATGTVLRNGARLYLDGSLVVQDEFLTVDSYGNLLSNDVSEWSGDIGLSGNMSISYESTLLLSGNITGSAYSYLSLGGSGLLTLSGNNSIPDGQILAYGSLQVDGSLAGLTYLNVLYGNLQGAGDVQATYVWVYYGTFQMSGMLDTLQLYVQDGTIDPAGSGAIATTDTGDLVFLNTVLSLQLQSDADYDRVNVTGSVQLSGADLHLQLDYSPSIGQQFTIINNDGLDPVQGTFPGYMEGSLVFVGTDAFRISYVGGTGNDVTLTRVAAYFWSGEAGAGDTNWSTAANWLGGLAPTAGDFLVFPDLTTQTITTNDYTPGTNFGGITITGNDYVLAGNSIVLNGLENRGASNTLDLPIVLGDSLSLVNSGGDLKTSAIDLNGHSLTFDAYSYYGVISADGEISGSGQVIKTGYGLAILAAANTYSGTTQVNAGILEVRNAQALGATDGTAGSGTNVRGGVLALSGPFTVDNEMLIVGENGGTIQNVGSNIWTGDVHFGSFAQLQGYGDSLLFAGNLTSESYAQIGVSGIGLLELTGNSALSAAQFSVSSGVLQVDSVLTGVNALYINYGGTLQGAGTIVSSYVQTYGGSIEFSGVLDAPQLDVQFGTIDPAGISATSILNSGSLSLWSGRLRMQLAGDADYDQVNVAGEVSLAYSTLELAVGYAPTIGKQFTLINNDDTDAVLGIFNNQPEGSLIATDNMAFRISYVGGDGNDVVLTRVAAGFWNGGAGAGDMRWRTAANWAGGVVPSPGEPLFFPSDAAQRSTVNNFPAGTSFNSINILGAGYTLAGNRVTLQAGLNDSGGDATVTLPITLAAPQSIVSYFGVLTVGAINQNGHQLTLDAASGSLIANGQISGAGGLIATGYGEVTLTSSNTYSGTTTINGGTLRIQNANSLGSANGKLATGTTLNGGNLILDGSFKVSNELLTVENYGTVVATGTDIWNGDVEIQGYTNLFVDRDHSLRIDGKLSSKDYQNIAATGQGLLELAGTSTFNGGGFYVYYGTLQVDKALTGLDALYAYYGATLQGAGTIGAAYIQGYYAVFRNSGSVNTSLFDVSYGSTIDPAGSIKTATLKTGNIALSSGTFEVQLNGVSSYDQLNVSGTVALYGAELHVALGFTPKVGQQFMLIQNDGTDAVDGTFNGYAEGDLVQSGDLAFRISYVGGTGNDVVLTRFSGTAVKDGVLYYFGTDDADSFDVKLLENAGALVVTTKSGKNDRGTVQQFNVADLTQIRVYLGGGNDYAYIDKKIQLTAIVDGGNGNDIFYAGGGNSQLFGGNGNDILYAGGGNSQLFGGNGNDWLVGGSGNNLLLGGDGNDLLQAGAGRDVLIGGSGNDVLQGGKQDDLLIGGTTSYDQNSFALEAILAEWTSDHSYEDRVANILGIYTGYPFYDRLNGDFFLNETTVFDDDSSDILQGYTGRDFYFARIGRREHSDWTDRQSSESIVEL